MSPQITTRRQTQVDGYIIDCNTGGRSHLRVAFEIKPTLVGTKLKILNGVTGYEALYVQDLLDFPAKEVIATYMLPGQRDGLILDGKHLIKILKQFEEDK